MIYHQLFAQIDRTVRVGVIGTGHYATALVTQSRVVDQLHVPVVCDTNPDAAQNAYHHAGLDSDKTIIADTTQQAAEAIEQGKYVILTDAMQMMDLPLDVIVESTGVPSAGAKHGIEAIRHGKHVAMVSKETDVTVGPILKHHADKAGLVYTAVDGDQHGLLMGLVQWARSLGLEVLCGGKSLDSDRVYDPQTNAIVWSKGKIQIPDEQIFSTQNPSAHIAQRRQIMGELGAIAGYDVTELTIAANATGLIPDIDTLHTPVVRTVEIPEVLAPKEDGGILSHRGVIDCVSCLRQANEPGLGGGVFIVIACENAYSRHILTTKGLIPNKKGTTALIYRPYHLCGVETPLSIAQAALLGASAGRPRETPISEVLAYAKRDLRPGDTLDGAGGRLVYGLIDRAETLRAQALLPLGLAYSARVRQPIAADRPIPAHAVQPPADSFIARLRAQTDHA